MRNDILKSNEEDMVFGVYANADFNDILARIKKGEIVPLEDDVEIKSAWTLAFSKLYDTKVVFDLNGHYFFTQGNATYGDAIQIQNCYDVTIKNGEIKAPTAAVEGNAAIAVMGNSNVVLENLTIKSERCVVNAKDNNNITIKSGTYTGLGVSEAVYFFSGSGSKIIIEGGVFKSEEAYKGKYYTLNIKDNLLTEGKDVRDFIEVRGGKFINYNPMESYSEPNSPKNFVADGYVVGFYKDGEDKVYIVMKDSANLPSKDEDGHRISWLNKEQPKNRIHMSAPEIEINRLHIDDDCKLYNVIECDKVTPIKNVYISDIQIDKPDIAHNFFSGYVFEDDAVVNFKDCSFNINPETTNPLRLCNMTNAKNVTVIFENVDWNYELAGSEDFQYAGLVIYQPWKTDKAVSGDTEALDTWEFIFRNCRYNGEKVTGVNFGEHSQLIYGYGIGSNDVQDLQVVSKAKISVE